MRLLAIAADPSLEVALTMMDDWEVLAVPDVRTAAERAHGIDALVIGLGSTGDGLAHAETARAEGINLPLIVVGDAPPPDDAEVVVVERPFSLDDIRAAVQHAVDHPAPLPSMETEAEPDPAPEELELPAPPEPVAEAPRAPSILGIVPDEDELDGIDLAEVEIPGVTSEPEPEPEPERERPPLRVAPPPAEPPAARTPMSGRTTTAPAAARVPDPEPDLEPEPAPAPAPEPEPEAEPDPQLERAPAPEPAPAPAPPVQPLPAAPAPVTTHPPAATSVEEPSPDRRSRRFGRRRPEPVQPQESPLERRLRAAARGVLEIEGLLHELPMVGDLNALCIALMGEIVDLVKPETAAVYVRRGGKFVIEAWHALSKSERTMEAKPEHPLFTELANAPEAMLIAPVELAQGLVAGIAGSHTRALIAAPVTVEGTAFAYIVLGRDDFSDDDLDAIDALAREAAPGLAVAQMLERLARKRARTD